nr:immunoglobulin heavy chain junction region [Macaca mulatta]MOY18373.1 immunoglobulin heavy chain junction region [Macaca mulatta]MOY19774.1 immunoglobulin heavy chain junction region [Macaca mulatta]
CATLIVEAIAEYFEVW